MAIRPDWETGTITLSAGAVDFTTTGSALQTAAISAGDAIITPAGLVLIIAEITGQNAGRLMAPCPVAAAGSDQQLRIRYQPDGSRLQGAMRMVRELLSTGNLDAFAALEARPNSVPVFTGFGTLGLMDTDMLGGGSAGGWDATVFDLAGLDAYADRPASFRVMVIDAGASRSAVFQKVTNAAGDWSQPIYFTGNDGRIGDKGEAGKDFDPQIGLLSERAAYDNEPVGFAFLATDAAAIYFRQGAAGEWSAPIPFGEGKPGADGLSAYQIAVQEGFAGTQAEWLASLHGSDASVTTANVGAAVAAAAGEQSISDADTVAGVKSGTSSMRRWTWGIVKAWIKGWITKADVDLGNVANKSEAQMVASGAIAEGLNSKASYNWIINGDFTVNQRGGVKKPANGVYGFDRWKGHASGIEQIIEALPAGEYTLTWSGGGNGTFGGQTKASPIKVTVAGGNTSVVVPETATKVSVVVGDSTAKDPWLSSTRPTTFEKIICERYYQIYWLRMWGGQTAANFGATHILPTSMRVNPSVITFGSIMSGGTNLRVENARINRFDVLISGNNTEAIFFEIYVSLDAEF